MLAKDDLESICSVKKMALAVHLSRARFYQLVAAGAFPPPIYDIHTKWPMYPLSLQQTCMEIRRTGIGFDGRPLRFNSPRKTRQTGGGGNTDGHKAIIDVLNNLGVRATEYDIIGAVTALYPQGLPTEPPEAKVIREVLRYLQG